MRYMDGAGMIVVVVDDGNSNKMKRKQKQKYYIVCQMGEKK